MLPDPGREAVDDAVHHLLTVQQREMLRPAQIPQVGAELVGALGQVSQIRVGQRDPPLPAQGLRDLDVADGELVADAARPGVQEQPDPVLLVEADFDEMVPGSERSELEPPVRRDALGATGSFPALQLIDPGRRLIAVNRGVVLARGQWDRVLNSLAEHGQVITLEVARGELGADSDHAAANVDSNASWHDRAEGRDHGTDGRTLAEVAVAHQRDVRVDEWYCAGA